MSRAAPGRLSRQNYVRQILPFLVMAAVAFPLVLLPPPGWRGSWVLAAGVVYIAVVIAVLMLPWDRLPAGARAVPALAYMVVVGLLRHAEGGVASGFTPLLFLPVFWMALFGSRRQLVIMLLAAGVTLIGPVLVFGSPEYPLAEWRRMIVLLGVGTMVGYAIHHLVAQVRSYALDINRRREEMATTEASLAAVGLIARELSHDEDVRRQVCEAARDLSDADIAFIVEPFGGNVLGTTASLGLDGTDFEVQLGGDSGTARAFSSGEPALVSTDDSRPGGRGSPLEPALTDAGVRAVLYQPMQRHQESVGVLGVAWLDDTRAMPEGAGLAIELLADESAVALERVDLLRKLDSMARTDPLTGLPNRRAWEDALRREAARADRGDYQFGLALLDLDHFKVFNDTHGHQAGDQLLQRIAAIWQLHLRDTDVLARWGGEEFAVLLAGCDEPTALTTVERLRTTIPEGQTCSAGLAVWAPEETPESLVERADKALYRAKKEGRDRTVSS